MTMVIDAHQHFWDPDDGEFDWMQGPDMAPIRRNFWPQDLAPLLAAAQVDKTVIVQTWSSLDETRHFLDLARQTDFVAGVVGWADLTSPSLASTLDALQAAPGGEYLVGIRHQVHDEADAQWLLRDDVQRGLELLQSAGLVYDLLTRPRELPAALETVARFPSLKFVVDHISKPDIAAREIDDWTRLMEGFRELDHVYCKLSGMVTEADWKNWRPQDLAPYIGRAVDIFGCDRLLFGSDWPVCLLAASYADVKDALESNIAHLSAHDQKKIMGGNAIDLYQLPLQQV